MRVCIKMTHHFTRHGCPLLNRNLVQTHNHFLKMTKFACYCRPGLLLVCGDGRHVYVK